jgi:tRNA 2-thiouridine synthesizing protein A
MGEPIEPPARVVDARGHRCPLPALRLRRALEECSDGGIVELLADDPIAKIDVPFLVNQLNYAIVLFVITGDDIRIQVRKVAGLPNPAT